MTTKQLQWIMAYSFAAAALILVLGNQSNVGTANAQVGVPPVYIDTDDDDDDDDGDDDSRHRTMSNKVACKASDIIDMDVRTVGGDEAVGSINDLMIRHDGRVGYAAVSFGGFLGMGDKLFAVPIQAIEFVKVGEGDDAEVYARIDVSEQTLKTRQGFDQDHWPAEADRSFLVGNQRVGRALRERLNQ